MGKSGFKIFKIDPVLLGKEVSMKKFWALLMGIMLFGNVMMVVIANGDIGGSKDTELKEVRVLKALWAWDSGVRGFVTTRFSKSQCILLQVELSVKSLQGKQIGEFLDKAGSIFELVAEGNSKVTARVFESSVYNIDGQPTLGFGLVIPDADYAKMATDVPYLLTIIETNQSERWIIKQDIWLTKSSRVQVIPAIKTERIMFNANIDSHKYQLEAMIYKPAASGRHPLIIMNHGRNGPHPSRNPNEIMGYQALNVELASEGYVVMMLVRRGYGNSEGPDNELQNTAVESGLEAAKDIQSAVDFMLLQDYIVKDKVLVMGHSQGGWAALASATVKMSGVLGVVNLCGGTNYREMGSGKITPEVQSHWIKACGELGKLAVVPSLWIYSENDYNHHPSYVNQMFAVFENSGGRGKLIIKPPYGENGHMIIREPELFMGDLLEFFHVIDF